MPAGLQCAQPEVDEQIRYGSSNWVSMCVGVQARDYLNTNMAAVRGLITEVLTLSRLQHPFVVTMLGYCFEPCICLVMELVPGGDLADLLSCASVALSVRAYLLCCVSKGRRSPRLPASPQQAAGTARSHPRPRVSFDPVRSGLRC